MQPKHFREFDYILGSDTANMRALTGIKPGDSTADGSYTVLISRVVYQNDHAVKLWGDWDDGNSIADPYYGGLVGRLAYSSLHFNTYPCDRMVSKPALRSAKGIRTPFSMRWSQSGLQALCDGTRRSGAVPQAPPLQVGVVF